MDKKQLLTEMTRLALQSFQDELLKTVNEIVVDGDPEMRRTLRETLVQCLALLDADAA